MLKLTIVCVMLLAAAAIAWDQLDPVEYPAEVQAGSAITYGDGKIWGIFPDPSDSSSTYFEYYDPYDAGGPRWVYPGEAYDLCFLGDPAITFNWRFGGEVLVVGNEDGDPYYPTLYSYSLVDSSWDFEEIEDFSLGAGASIAFRPAADYYGTYVAGWMYCLVGGGTEFWCYSLPGPGDVTVDGICPGETSLIADQTPFFIWGPVQNAEKYKITVSPNSDMSNPVFVDSTNDTTYQTTDTLDNDVYYWQIAHRVGITWTAGSVHSFTLEGGWTQLSDIPVAVYYGASLAYEKDFYSNQECLVALAGDGYQYLSIYYVDGDSWNNVKTTPNAQGVGSAIVTHEAADETPPDPPGPWVMFGGADSLHHHENARPPWIFECTAPLVLGAGASLAYSIESSTHCLYLIVGEDGNGPRNNFYRLEIPGFARAEQGGSGRFASSFARPINDPGRVTVQYQLSASARVRASIFDAAGRQLGELDAGIQKPGAHRLSWSQDAQGRGLSAGAYFVHLAVGTEQATLKVVVR